MISGNPISDPSINGFALFCDPLNKSTMNILDIRTMRGPNYWSVRRHKLIVMRLDLEEMEDRPTDKVDGFFDRMNGMHWIINLILEILFILSNTSRSSALSCISRYIFDRINRMYWIDK